LIFNFFLFFIVFFLTAWRADSWLMGGRCCWRRGSTHRQWSSWAQADLVSRPL